VLFPLFGISFTLWMVWGFQAEGIPADTLQTNAAVQVSGDDTAIRFEPRVNKRTTGVIFLPGGMVEPEAYTPLLKNLAAAGYPAHLVRLPLRCACVDSQIAALFAQITATVNANPGTRWYLAGHSRGAMLATRFAHEAPPNLAGLILIGTTHPRDFDLSATPLKVTKIFGTNDGVASPAAIRANAKLLPPSTSWIEIPGANHVQFGFYRHQLFDGSPGIGRAEQQTALLKAVRRALDTSTTVTSPASVPE
jgi:pimeloyl-ACP methyl ester carboxylesterase